MSCRRSSLRTGFSLLEILLATSMLAVALAALTQLSSIGRKHLTSAAKQAVAARFAANQLARISAGIEPLEDREARPLSEDPDWECEVALKLVDGGDLVEVEVGVRPLARFNEETASLAKPWFKAAQWIPLKEGTLLRSEPQPSVVSTSTSLETLP